MIALTLIFDYISVFYLKTTEPAEDYDMIRYSPDYIQGDEEEEAYGHLMKSKFFP